MDESARPPIATRPVRLRWPLLLQCFLSRDFPLKLFHLGLLVDGFLAYTFGLFGLLPL